MVQLGKTGAPGRIRTFDLRIRSPLLYPAELQAHMVNEELDYKIKGEVIPVRNGLTVHWPLSFAWDSVHRPHSVTCRLSGDPCSVGGPSVPKSAGDFSLAN